MGNIFFLEFLLTGGRFTPTCVGNMRRPASQSRPPPVHPHVRGEHIGVSRECGDECGSPPRAWGTFEVRDLDLHVERFTPTCVGNICYRTSCCRVFTVHPHVRGEHSCGSASIRCAIGSPPRAWGTSDFTVDFCRIRRFTPTCVGNIYPATLISSTHSVHPHVRGEH